MKLKEVELGFRGSRFTLDPTVPLLMVQKANILFSAALANIMELGKTRHAFVFANDEESPGDWYVCLAKEDDQLFKFRFQEKTSNYICGKSKKTAYPADGNYMLSTHAVRQDNRDFYKLIPYTK